MPATIHAAPRALAQFDADFHGPVTRPTDPDYDHARSVWNGSIDRYPAMIAHCSGLADVQAAVRFAQAVDGPIAVRGGGHSVAGNGVCDRGLVIDLSGLQGVHVDPEARTARVEPGVTWADFDRDAQVHGLATTGGLMSSTGVAGLTLGGGVGWLMRTHGLTCDNLRSADVVTASGDVVTASEARNPDLFWALRGGGGNFGIVTSFEFELHPVGPAVYGGMLLFDQRRTGDVLRRFRDVVAQTPGLGAAVVLRDAPQSPKLPEEVRGAPVVIVAGLHPGSLEDGEHAFGTFRELGEPLVDAVSPQPYLAVQSMTDASWTPGYRNYWKANYLAGLDDDAIDVLADYAGRITSPISDVKVAALGGAVSRVPVDATAYPHRDAPFVLNINARWERAAEDERHRAWTRSLWQDLQRHSTGGTYVNFLGDEGEHRVREAYGRAYPRLREVKARWDPGNLFRCNQNIPPTVSPDGYLSSPGRPATT